MENSIMSDKWSDGLALRPVTASERAVKAVAASLDVAFGRASENAAARHILGELKAAGIAVVELPEETIIPTGWGDDCLGAWKVSDKEDPVSAWPPAAAPLEQVALPDGDFVTPEHARRLAAALLAAAAKAEAVSS